MRMKSAIFEFGVVKELSGVDFVQHTLLTPRQLQAESDHGRCLCLVSAASRYQGNNEL